MTASPTDPRHAGHDPHRPVGVAVLGYSFMGKAHSNAWRNVRAFFPDVPAGPPGGPGRP